MTVDLRKSIPQCKAVMSQSGGSAARLCLPITLSLIVLASLAPGDAFAQEISASVGLTAESILDGVPSGPDAVDEDLQVRFQPGGGSIDKAWELPTTPVRGGTTGTRIVSFVPLCEAKLSLEQRRLKLKSVSQATLNHNYVAEGALPVDFGVSSRHGVQLVDGLIIVPNDTSFYGRWVSFDFTVKIEGALVAAVENSDSPSAFVSYRISDYDDDVEDDYSGELYSSGRSEGEVNFATPQMAVFQGFAFLGSKQFIGQNGGEFGGAAGVEIELRAQIEGDKGSAGDVLKAELELTLTLESISNIRLEDGTPMANSEFKSSSFSGHDYLGSGPPDDPDPEPEPIEGHHWINPEGGVFGVAENWFDTDGNGLSDDIPGITDNAVFAIPTSYSVTLAQDQTIDDLIVSGDDSIVTFNPDGHRLFPTEVYVGYRDGDNATLVANTHDFRVAQRIVLGERGNGHLRITGPAGLKTRNLTIKSPGSSALLTGVPETPREFLEITHFLEIEAGSLVVESRDSPELQLAGHLKLKPVAEGDVVYMVVQEGSTAHFRNGGKATFVDINLSVGDENDGNGIDLTAPLATLLVEGGHAVTNDPGFEFQGSEFFGVGGHITVGNHTPGLVHIRDGGAFGFALLTDEPFAQGSWDILIGNLAPGELLVEGVHSGDHRSFVQADQFLFNIFSIYPDAEQFTASMTVRGGARAKGRRFELYSPRCGVFVDGAGGGETSEIEIEEDLFIHGSVVEATNGGEITFDHKMNITADQGGRIVVREGGSIVGPIEPLSEENSDIQFSTDGSEHTTALTVSGVRSDGQRSSLFQYQGDNLSGIRIGAKPDLTGLTTVSVENGGRLEATTSSVWAGYGSRGQLAVDGVDLTSGIRSTASMSFLNVGFDDGSENPVVHGNVDITDGGLVECEFGLLVGDSVLTVGPDAGQLVSELRCSEVLSIGNASPTNGGFAELGIEGGHVTVGGRLEVQLNGAITGVGTLTVPAGGVYNSGFIAPGFSPGTLTIEGNFTQEELGTLIIEIAGPAPAAQDQLVVSGDVALGGTVQVIFSGYAPKADDTYAFVDVGGTFQDNDFEMVVSGLKEGFESKCELADGKLTLTALTDGEPLTAEDPIQTQAFRVTPDGGIRLPFFGVEGITYHFETSTDLTEWNEVSQIVGESELHTFSHQEAGATRYYRIRASGGE